MGNLTVNLFFGAIFAGFAWNSFPRGWRFFRVGWNAFRANTPEDNQDFDVERQRELESGSTFLIAGLAWLAGGFISALLTVIFVVFAFLDIGIFNFIS